MAAYSKLLRQSCYELGHTWQPSCVKTALGLALITYSESFKIYAPLYAVGSGKISCHITTHVLLRLSPVVFTSVSDSDSVQCFTASSRYMLYVDVALTTCIASHLNFIYVIWLCPVHCIFILKVNLFRAL